MSAEKIITQKHNFILITPASFDDSQFACPVCDCLLYNDDRIALQRFSCCNSCADAWAFKNQENWDAGWRPTSDEVNQHMLSRSLMRVNIGTI